MADVTFTVSADEAKAIRAYQKLIDKQRQAGDAAKRTGDVSKRASDRSTGGMNRLRGSVGGVVAGLVGVGGLLAAFQRIREEMRKTAEAGKETIGTLQAAIAGAGDIAHYDEISHRLRHSGAAGARLLGMKERAGVYESVRGSLPLAPREEVMRLAETAMGAQEITGDVEATARFGGVLGELKKILPGKERGDLADIATYISQAAGKHGEQLDKAAFKGIQQLVQQGIDPERALGMLVAAQESAQGARALSSYASYVARGKTGTLDPAAQTLLGQLEERDYVGQIRAAQSKDVFAHQILGARKSRDIRARQEMRRGEVELELAEYDDRRKDMGIMGKRKRGEARMRQDSVPEAVRWANLQLHDVLRAFGGKAKTVFDVPDIEPPGGGAAGGSTGASPKNIEKAVEKGTARGSGFATMDRNSDPRDILDRVIGFTLWDD